MSSSQFGNLTTIIKRLEAATSRLEDLSATATSSSQLKQPTSTVADTVGSHVAPSPAPPAPAAAAPAQAQEDSPAVKAFDAWLEEHLKPYLDQSEALGGVVKDQSKLVASLFDAQRSFIVLASQCAKPSADKLQPLLGPMIQQLTAVGDIKDANRRSPQFNHLSTVSEGIPAAGWVALDAKPGPYIGDMKESANFYGNRVIKEFKDTDKTQVEWVKSFINALEELRKYVMATHTTGLVWNPQGKDVTSFVAPASSKGVAAPKGLFSDIGGDVTKGLRKVDKSEMTHKNPELRASSVVAESSSALKRPARPTKPPSLQGKKPSKTELVGNRWEIEYHEGNSNIVLDQTEINQVVNIYGCKNSVVQVKGKVNAINLISCSKTSVLLESIVSSLSITSSPSFTVQILGMTPTINIEQTDSGQVYLSKECVAGETEIITAKCSAINISLPDPNEKEEGMFVERAVPEQLKTVIKDGKLVTTIVEHSG